MRTGTGCSSSPDEEVGILSHDGLKLHGTYFPGPGNKVVICFHGYTSNGMSEYPSLARCFMSRGFGALIIDQRSHGQSEGKYIGFGCMDRLDALEWIRWTVDKVGQDAQIILHGGSMGGATVCMVSGLDLPPQVKGIISDSAFTSPKYVFTHVLHSMYHLPATPMIPLADKVNKRLAGYRPGRLQRRPGGTKGQGPHAVYPRQQGHLCSPPHVRRAVMKTVPRPRPSSLSEGAGHVESYYKNTQEYEEALDKFIGGIIV